MFEACLDHLPGKQAQVFMMREFIELDSHEVCQAVDITVSNLNVMLRRARRNFGKQMDVLRQLARA